MISFKKMGCVQLRVRPIFEYDLGYERSPEGSPTNSNMMTDSTKNPLNMTAVSNFVKFRRNGMECYFCNSNFGLLLRPFTCRCNYFGHYDCFKQWIKLQNYKCSICQADYYPQRNNYGTLYKYEKEQMCISSLRKCFTQELLRQECLLLIKSKNI